MKRAKTMRGGTKLHLAIDAVLAEAETATIAELCERCWPGEPPSHKHSVR